MRKKQTKREREGGMEREGEGGRQTEKKANYCITLCEQKEAKFIWFKTMHKCVYSVNVLVGDTVL